MSLPVVLLPGWGRALVAGGGRVGLRKVRGLAAAGFGVTVVDPAPEEELRGMEGVELVERTVCEEDLAGMRLVYACTDDRAVNRQVGAWARARGIPVLVADAPSESTFLSPAVHRDGAWLLAVSTGGADPAAAARLRDRLAAYLQAGGWEA